MKRITKHAKNVKELATTIVGLIILSMSLILYFNNSIGIDILLIFIPCPIALIFSKDSLLFKNKKKKHEHE